MFVAAGGLGFEPAEGASQRPVVGLAHPVIAHKQGVFILTGLKQQLLFDAVVDDLRMDPAPLQIRFHRITAAVHIRQQQAALFGHHRRFWGRVGPQRRAGQLAHGLREGHLLDLHQIIQRIPSADASGEPMPFPIGDFQTVMLPGAIGAAGDMDQLAGLIGLQIAQKVNLPGGLNGRCVYIGHHRTSFSGCSSLSTRPSMQSRMVSI